ncbi:MAG: ATP-binding protein [candidate division WOR-3 bacterium]
MKKKGHHSVEHQEEKYPFRVKYGRRLAEEFCALSRRILRAANQGMPRSEFARLVLEEFINFSGCDSAEIRVNEGTRYYRGVLTREKGKNFSFEIVPRAESQSPETMPEITEDTLGFRTICDALIRGDVNFQQGCFASNGGFWSNDTSQPVDVKPNLTVKIGGAYSSIAILPFVVSEDSHGLIILKSLKRGYFKKYEIEFYQGVAQSLGVAIADRRAQAALRERVKELDCLYYIDKILEQSKLELAEALQAVVEKLPAAWLYPEIASARIVFDDKQFTTTNYKAGVACQRAPIVVRGKHRGVIEVVYLEGRPELDEGPFLKEERNLINAVAREVGLFIERREIATEQAKLETQLRHADRLATIGQLAAGVAHELNEPLSNILGFAQLAQKVPNIPPQATQDIERIVQAVLHAREIVSKLMTFARQKPPLFTEVNLNQLINEGLYFLASRCAKSGIELIRDLTPDLPEIIADPGQLYQVLVNLVVNAIQAMPNGGRLRVATMVRDETVSLIVEDSGVGMTEKEKSQIFVPFYTTKPEGTGLGLSVVYGIVTAHGGSIKVESEPGKGSRFEVLLPIKGNPIVES